MSHAKRLGMGLDALLAAGSPAQVKEAPVSREPNGTVETDRIRPNPFQPRADFDDEEIRRLSDSIRRQGVLQPVVVRRRDGVFQLIAGERRLRAAREAGLERIPAVVRELDDRKMLEFAMVENLQRSDLNPIEKARAFRQLMQLNGWTQEQVAEAVGLGRPTVANFLRLLDLPAEIQETVSRGTISMGHARALLAVPQKGVRMQLLKRVIEEDLSVRALEQLVAKPSSPAAVSTRPAKEPYLEELERKLMDRVGSKVEIQPKAIVIRYASNDELSAILRRLGAL